MITNKDKLRPEKNFFLKSLNFIKNFVCCHHVLATINVIYKKTMIKNDFGQVSIHFFKSSGSIKVFTWAGIVSPSS